MKVQYSILTEDQTHPLIGFLEVPDGGSDPMSDTTNYEVIKNLWTSHLEGNFEHVTVFNGERYLDMFVDDIGQIKQLLINEKGTMLYWNNLFSHDPAKKGWTFEDGLKADLPTIRGPVILFHEKVWF